MCSALINGASKLINGAYTIVSTPCHYTCRAYNCLGKQITRLTDDKLPPSLAKFTQQIYHSLPYTAGVVALTSQPLGIVLGAALLYAGAHVVCKEPFAKQTYVNLYSGVAHAAAYGAISALARGILSRNPLLACSAAVHTLSFLWMQAAANRVQASETAPKPQETGCSVSSLAATPLQQRA